ncbi:MAG TPA: DoxX family protein [Candidatus Acidoferrum sp.]|nr:DoxX family protein [Candidatus Acidoferrum sp.]
MTASDLGLFVLRVVVGLIFAAHGAQKAFGWWSGPGPQRWRDAIGRMRFQPVGLWAPLSMGVELVAGVLVALGFLTSLAAAVLIGQAIVIIVVAHWRNGFWDTNHGYEFPLVLAAALVALALIGPGPASIDGLAGIVFTDAIRFALVLLGIAGGVGAIVFGRAAEEAAVR